MCSLSQILNQHVGPRSSTKFLSVYYINIHSICMHVLSSVTLVPPVELSCVHYVVAVVLLIDCLNDAAHAVRFRF